MNYPRVMHVGFNPIGSQNNTGLTLASMFGDWPTDRLLEVYFRCQPAAARVENALVAPASAAPVDAAIRAVLGRRLPPPLGDGLNNSVSRKGQRLDVRTRARVAASTINDVGPVRVTGSWIGDMEAFAPQVIHSLLGSVRVTKLVARLAERLDIPVVPHFMDDWPSTMFADGRLGGLPRREVAKALDRVLERAPLCLTIGQDMADEFSKRYGRRCVIVGNSVDFESFRALDTHGNEEPGDVLNLRYVGGLHLGRAAVISRLARVLESREGPTWRLVVHAPESDSSRLNELAASHPNVAAGDTLLPHEVPRALVASDALLFIESTDPAICQFTRWSVSTKVPEYLAAGRPVLAIGPEDQASIRALVGAGRAWFGGDGGSRDEIETAMACIGADRRQWATPPPVDPSVESSFGLRSTRARLKSALNEAAAT